MTAIRPSIDDKRRSFRQLHEAGCFVIPNPWDVGSALYLQSLGFKALATTSSGFAWSKGYPDNGISRDMALAHLRDMVAATDLPVNADFESGFAKDPSGVEESVRLAIETGVAGLSIEDSTGDAVAPPQTASFSTTITFSLCHAAVTAAESPAAPDPTTSTSQSTSRERELGEFSGTVFLLCGSGDLCGRSACNTRVAHPTRRAKLHSESRRGYICLNR